MTDRGLEAYELTATLAASMTEAQREQFAELMKLVCNSIDNGSRGGVRRWMRHTGWGK